MIGYAIIACEVGFWVVLGAGLLARYGLGRPRLGAVLLAGVPLVDLTLLVVTGLDLARGAEAEWTHGLAAAYLGFTVAFGHGLIRTADGWAARRTGAADAPARPARRTGAARVAHEWRTFAKAVAATAVASAALGLLVLIGGTEPTRALWEDGGWFARLAVVCAMWLLLGPLWARTAERARRPYARRGASESV